VLHAVQSSQHKSVYTISAVIGIPQSQVWRTVQYDLYSYIIKSATTRSHTNHVQFFRQFNGQSQLVNYILFMDVTRFQCDVITNVRNLHSWLHNIPHEVVESNFQHTFSVNTWYGLVGNHLCGPHFIEGHLTAASYKHFLKNELQLHLENVPLQTRRIWIQHTGAPPHFRQRHYRVLDCNLSRKVERTRYQLHSQLDHQT
jgi:hypothetical protein